MNLRAFTGGWVMALCAGLLAAGPAQASEDTLVDVVEPYLELHTGPGRDYPVFHVVPRGERVVIEKRRTDWFRVRDSRGKIGWTHRAELEKTLTAAGERRSFRDLMMDDYLARRLEAGVAWGVMDQDPLFALRLGYRLSPEFTLEAASTVVQGTFSGTTVRQLTFMATPFSDWRLAPFFGIGFGRFQNTPKPTLVRALATDSMMAYMGTGARFYITDRFMARVDFGEHVVFLDDNRTYNYRALSGGFSFFF